MAMRMRPPPGAFRFKGAQDWLTEADGAVERFLRGHLETAFPDDGFQGEEDATIRPGNPRWIVDPIDGTSNFARGGARWGVSLGLVEDGQAVLGVICAPALGDTYAAMVGGGATLNGQPVRAADTPDLSRAIVEVGWSPRRSSLAHRLLYARLQDAGAMVRNSGSAAVGLAEVAAGRLDGYAELHVNVWDVAGALAILAESGAACTPYLPSGLDGGAHLVAAAPLLFPAIADALHDAMQGDRAA